MGQMWRGVWSPWKRHDGSGMPVPKGTIVEVFSGEDPKTARGGVVQRIGVAGIDLIQSWYWTAETRDTQRALPIDRYRSWKTGKPCAQVEAASQQNVPEDA